MKFELNITSGGKRLVLIPDDAAEASLLATICDPNTLGDSQDEKKVRAKVIGTSDRAPYRKVKELHIIL